MMASLLKSADREVLLIFDTRYLCGCLCDHIFDLWCVCVCVSEKGSDMVPEPPASYRLR